MGRPANGSIVNQQTSGKAPCEGTQDKFIGFSFSFQFFQIVYKSTARF